MRLIDNHHIEMWVASKVAEIRFPYWIRALICAVIKPDQLRMPWGDAVWMPGPDGVLDSTDDSEFVPRGVSVWEASTKSDFRAKAKEDYDKRSTTKPDEGGKSKLRVDRLKATFVFVTPWLWPNKDNWEADREKEGIWEHVVVIDGEVLKNWLEAAPAVALQFAAEIGLVPEAGLTTPDQAWDEWSNLTDKPTSEEFVTAGREVQEKELAGRLAGQPCIFTVRSSSPREGWGFALAAIRRIGPEADRASLLARTLVADDEEIAGRLCNHTNLVIVLRRTHGAVSGVLASKGNHVIVPEGNDSYTERNVIVLARPTHREVVTALVNMQVADDEAERRARACGLSVTVFQRLYASANSVPPDWVSDNRVTELFPALLFGVSACETNWTG
jgi:hypothetical protein